MALVRLRDGLFHRRGIEAKRIVDLHDHGDGVAGDDRGGRGEKRVRRHDHLVAGPDPQRPIRADQRRGAGIDRQAVLHADQSAKAFSAASTLLGRGL